MSGPKLIGFTCDPEIIRKNNELLEAVGKQVYYKGIIEGLNIDLENTIIWLRNYGNNTLQQTTANMRNDKMLLNDVERVKKEYIELIRSNLLDIDDIPKMSVEQLNKICGDRVRGIPQWKQRFIDDISNILKELQNKLEQNNLIAEEIKKKGLERKKRKKMIWAEESALSNQSRILYEDINVYNNTALENIPGQVNRRDNNYDLDEMAVIENLEHEILEYEQMRELSYSNRKLVEEIKEGLNYVDIRDKHYLMEGKRRVLVSIQAKFQILMKNVAEMNIQREEQEQERRTLELEYTMFKSALAEDGDVNQLSTEVLRREVEDLRQRVEKQEERIYIEQSMTEIMSKYGYKGISSTHLHEYEQNSRIIFENFNDEKLSVSFGQGKVMLQVVGEGEKTPTLEEKKELLKQQGALCQIYPEIKTELEKRKIHINMENCAPPSVESAVNISMKRDYEIKNKRGRRSVLNQTFKKGTVRKENEERFSERYQPLYMYNE